MRDDLKNFLQKKNIYVGIHYPIPIHLQKAYFKRIRTHQNLSITEKISKEILSLPIYPELEIDKQECIIQSIKDYFNNKELKFNS